MPRYCYQCECATEPILTCRICLRSVRAERDRLAAENAELRNTDHYQRSIDEMHLRYNVEAELARYRAAHAQLVIDYEQVLDGLTESDATLDALREAVPEVLPPHMSWKDALDGARAILYPQPPETTDDEQ